MHSDRTIRARPLTREPLIESTDFRSIDEVTRRALVDGAPGDPLASH